MTTAVHVYLTVPIDGGEAPAPGSLEWTPTRRRTATGRIILPASLPPFPLEDGEAIVDVDPTGADWCWRVRERVPGGIVRYVAVPDVPTVEYSALVDVDPKTFDPAAEPEAAWWAAWAAMAAGTYLVPDPAHPGLYLPMPGSSFAPDPLHSGLYTIGAPA